MIYDILNNDILKKKQEEKSYDMQKLTPNYSKHNRDIKQEEKSYDTQKFTPNHSKHDCDVTSPNFSPVKLRNEEICPEYSQKNTSVDNYDFIMQPYETIPPIKLRKTTHQSTVELSENNASLQFPGASASASLF